MESRYVVSSDGANPYSPANHSGTTNQRVISRETVGAKYLEVLIGTIEKGHGALRHMHPNLEQASYLLQGEGLGELNGGEQITRPGHWMFTPEGTPHRFGVTSDTPVKVLVVYAPPYAENPMAAVNCEDAPAWALDVPQGSPRHMAIYEARLEPGGKKTSHALNGMEQVIFVQKGAVTGHINGHYFEATEGDWIFFPDGATHEYSAKPDQEAAAFVIHAFSPNHKV